MLKLVNIKKDYKVGGIPTVHALKGVSINFRSNELVSILGPSGCGKTTMLNLIGGLDHATEGDLIIGGKSTMDYRDRDWDVYRNHRIGFIFQSYNLIPHQTVLGNVELALTIAGIGKTERTERAKAALDKVGLSDQYYKRPNQLSGGQCQRVAIARALVNDPEILLADEPTGALDTKTSKEIMELVKEIAGERLVIMVTHNPELAEEYSTRIIRLLDGNLQSDSNPYTDEAIDKDTQAGLAKEAEEIAANGPKKAKAKMSLWTAFKLSLRNLFTKKRRTLMTSIAGSIGIIGVSMVLAISFGIQGFMNNMQNDMLASNPIEITQQAFDLNALTTMDFGMGDQAQVVIGNWANVDSMIASLNEQFESFDDLMVNNRIDQNYVQFLMDMPQEYWSAMFFNYGIDIGYSIYTDFEGRQTALNGIRSIYGSILDSHIDGFDMLAPMLNMLGNPISQAPDLRNEVTRDYFLSQFDVLHAREGTDGLAREANEIMIILDSDRMVTDLVLAQLGFYTQAEFANIVFGITEDARFDEALAVSDRIEFEDLIDRTFAWFPNDEIFSTNPLHDDIPFVYSPFANASWDNGLELTIVGILEPNPDAASVMLNSGFFYTTALAEYIMGHNWNSQLAQFMRYDAMTDSLMGIVPLLPNGDMLFMAPDPDVPGEWMSTVSGSVITFSYEYTFGGVTRTSTRLVGAAGGNLFGMLFGGMGGGGSAPQVASANISIQSIGANVESNITRDSDGAITDWEVVLNDGYPFLLPNSIAIFASNFVQMDNITAYLDNWNSNNTITLSSGTVLRAADRERVVYTDMLSFIMGMLSALLQIITVALIAFTSLSLIVSCVMIAIITYVSVVERIKEIGVIRSLGGRKRDVSNLFIAETFIIGLVSGVIGITVTYLMSGFANLVVGLLGIGAIASFPWWMALIMVGVSVGLTLVSGLVPSQSAAKKDPVVALRSE